jgi:hypothetical protein
MMVEEMGPVAQIGEAPTALSNDGNVVEDFELAEAYAPAPKALAPKASDTPAPKPTAEEVKLYRDPEEAAYASLIDSQAGQNAAKRYFAGENVGLANISEALKAYKGFKDTEMGQRQKINEAQIKKAATAREARTADAELALKQAQIRGEIDKPTAERLKALNTLIQAKTSILSDMAFLPATDPRKIKVQQDINALESQLQPFLKLPSPALEALSEMVGISATKPLNKKAK